MWQYKYQHILKKKAKKKKKKKKKKRYTRHMHHLYYRKIHIFAAYYQQSFYPATIVLWYRLPSDIVLRADPDSFQEGVCKINHQSP